jgi:hypothetical protein
MVNSEALLGLSALLTAVAVRRFNWANHGASLRLKC